MHKIDKDKNEQSLFQLFGRSIISLVIIITIIVLFNNLFHDAIFLICRQIFEVTGGSLVSIGYFSTSFLLPFIPDDMFSATALLGGVNPFFIFILAWTGSILGACLAYYFGKSLKIKPILQKVTYRDRDQINRLLNKYGNKAIGIVALTPLPDAPFSWICGASSISFTRFILTYTLCRGIKLAYAIYFLSLAIGGTH